MITEHLLSSKSVEDGSYRLTPAGRRLDVEERDRNKRRAALYIYDWIWFMIEWLFLDGHRLEIVVIWNLVIYLIVYPICEIVPAEKQYWSARLLA